MTCAAVVGAPDVTRVEAVTPFVTLRPDGSASEEELRQTVRASLAGYKFPKTVQVIDAIPMSPVGKACAGRSANRFGADGDERSAVRRSRNHLFTHPLWQGAG